MQTHTIQIRLLVLFLLLAIASSGCGSIEIGLESSATPESPNMLVTPTPVSAPTVTPLPDSAALSDSGSSSPTPDWPYPWMTYRDVRYNYGMAIPCYWTINPSPLDGYSAAMTMHSYTEAYFLANSQKGYWEWPDGAMKIDWVVFEGVPPAQSTADALATFLVNEDQYIESTAEITVGETPALKIVTVSTMRGDPESFTSIIFRMESDKLLMFNVVPNDRLDNPIIQAILASYTAPTDDTIPVPQISPGEPPGNYDGPCGPAKP